MSRDARPTTTAACQTSAEAHPRPAEARPTSTDAKAHPLGESDGRKGWHVKMSRHPSFGSKFSPVIARPQHSRRSQFSSAAPPSTAQLIVGWKEATEERRKGAHDSDAHPIFLFKLIPKIVPSFSHKKSGKKRGSEAVEGARNRHKKRSERRNERGDYWDQGTRAEKLKPEGKEKSAKKTKKKKRGKKLGCHDNHRFDIRHCC